MNFKKGDKVYIAIDGRVYEEKASRDFWHTDFKLFKTKDDALCHLISVSRDTNELTSRRRHTKEVENESK